MGKLTITAIVIALGILCPAESATFRAPLHVAKNYGLDVSILPVFLDNCLLKNKTQHASSSNEGVHQQRNLQKPLNANHPHTGPEAIAKHGTAYRPLTVSP